MHRMKSVLGRARRVLKLICATRSSTSIIDVSALAVFGVWALDGSDRAIKIPLKSRSGEVGAHRQSHDELGLGNSLPKDVPSSA